MEYLESELKLYNERKTFGYTERKTYKIESELSQKEKLDFIDKHYVDKHGNTGMGTYTYNLFKKYFEDEPSLPKDSFGYVKTVSLKAWLRRNDPRNVIDRDYRYGTYYFAKREYAFISLHARPLWSSSSPYYGDNSDVVDLWFHDVLNCLADKEEQYFREHDKDTITIHKIMDYGNKYGSFGIKKISMVVGNGENVLRKEWRDTFKEPEVTSDELGKMLKLFEDFDKTYKLYSEKVFSETGWEKFEN